jgi:hypothetical protein
VKSIRLLLILWTVSGIARASPDALQRKYTIEAELTSLKKREILLKVEVDLINRGRQTLADIPIVLYPNRFQSKLPQLHDLNYRRIYPDGVSKGGLDCDGVKGEGTLGKWSLKQPLGPGERTSFQLTCRLNIPEKFGSFGVYRGVLTLSGGWYPYVPAYFDDEKGFRSDELPPQSDFSVRLKTDLEPVLAGRFSKKVEIHGAREISLWASHKLIRKDLAQRHGKVSIVYSESARVASESLEELTVRWLEFVQRQPDLQSGNPEQVIAVSPLRDSLVMKGEGVTFVSDRAFKVFSGLRQYHTTPIVHGLFYQLVLPSASARESSRDYHWVSDAIAWRWTERFARDAAFESVDARSLGPIRHLSFLFAVDRAVYAPQFAFFDVFYNYIYPYDPVRDDALTFNHERPFGRTIYAHIEDALGEEIADRSAVEYLDAAPQSFLSHLETVAKRELAPLYKQWSEPRPDVNYRLGKRTVAKTENGYHYSAEVLRESDTGIVEPVEFYFQTEDGKSERLIWNGGEDRHVFEFDTHQKVKVMEIDPRRRLLETHLSDNRKPPRYKVVLTDYVVDFDFNENQPTGYIAAQFRRSYGGANRYNASAYYTVDSYGMSLSFTRLFGRLIDRLRLSHGMNIGYSFSRISEDFAAVRDPVTGDLSGVKIGNEEFMSTLRLSYLFEDQLSLTNPLRGGGGGISVAWGNEYLGGDSNFVQGTLSGSWILPFHPSHFVALRGALGVSGPDSIPSRAQFSLGGIDGMRGLSINDEHFRGRYILITSAEYRHLLLSDVDWNLLLFRVRDVQGALFTDAGRVTDSLQDAAERAAGFSTRHTGFGDLFDVAQFSADAGYGVRFLVDYLGVNPGLIRFDAARSLNEGGTWRFYFGVTQSF